MKLSSPKLSAPALQDHVVSTRVLKAMSSPEIHHGHWLFAGPGAGKTQIARLWIQELGRPYAWLQLDAQDNDPLVLLEQLRLALQPLVHPQLLLPSYAPQSGVSLGRHCEYLWELLLDGLRAPCAIVLDDAHHIRSWPSHPVLDSLMRGLDERAHLLVLSRTDLDDHYVREVINRRIKRIEPGLFAWTTPQLKDWLSRRWAAARLTEATAKALLTLSQGRAAILALLDIPALLANPDNLVKQAAKQLELSELMESSLLARLAPEERESLFWLACLGSFPNKWLFALGFSPAVQSLLSAWHQSASVVHSLEQDPDEWRFHPLFAEILRGTHRRPDQAPLELRDRLVDACVAEGRTLDAISLCRYTECWKQYWTLLQEVGLDWIAQGKIASLSKALADLPLEAASQLAGPNHSLFMAATSLHEDPRLAYEQAMDALTQSENRPELRATWMHAMAIAAQAVIASGLQLSYLEPVIEATDLAIRSLWFQQLPAQLRLLALGAGMIASIAGKDRPPMQLLYEETEKAMLECADIDLQAATISAIARVVVLHGLPEYIESVEQHIKRVEHLAQSPAAQHSLLHAKIHNAQARGAYAVAERHARTLWNRRSPNISLIWIAETLASGAFGAAACQKISQIKVYSRELLKLRETCKDSSANFRLHSYMYQGCSAAHDGRWNEAQAHYQQAVHAADEYQYSLMQVCSRCCLAIVCIELDQIEAFEQLVREIETLLEANNLPLSRRVYANLRAFELVRRGPKERAIVRIHEFFEEMESSDHFLQVAAMLPQYTELLSFALTHQVKPKVVEKVIRRGLIYPQKRPHPQWPSYIEVQTLGRFEIRVNGKDARNKVVSSGRRFELLTALLWWGGQELSYDQCIEWIWHYIPDRPRARRSVKTALKRLNDDLGRDDAILDQGGKISLNPELWNYGGVSLREAPLSGNIAPNLASQLHRGFIGPTPIPPGMRKLVPTNGAIDLGPYPLLAFIQKSPMPE